MLDVCLPNRGVCGNLGLQQQLIISTLSLCTQTETYSNTHTEITDPGWSLHVHVHTQVLKYGSTGPRWAAGGLKVQRELTEAEPKHLEDSGNNQLLLALRALSTKHLLVNFFRMSFLRKWTEEPRKVWLQQTIKLQHKAWCWWFLLNPALPPGARFRKLLCFNLWATMDLKNG